MRNFRKYEVWKLSHELVIKVYDLTTTFPSSEKYQLVTQMQRAAYSIPSNFSEGCGRQSDKDFNRFIQIALGSAHELEYFFILARDLCFISEEDYAVLDIEVNEIKKKLYNLGKKL
ncbi:four helix bundle protein [Autumnicola psychrophila]|uniref:Four helix bundle protein n=1 Tax=Autumnicola psychrophila TaxID=3075592 RepID=A0ABU3DNF2_9FLAO|nr:four helix bundle protein [Zunongwangia sp. F225]MDT0685247.1 four helix bundle protein [Zunongwangia sp. F225]